jgi:quinol monooxygenase YgiN
MTSAPPETTLDNIAESYVRLVLAIGLHDADYVDAYFGPPQWRDEVKAANQPVDRLIAGAQQLLQNLGRIPRSKDEEMPALRHQYLTRQLRSAVARLEILQGHSFTFEEEAFALYDAYPPVYTAPFFEGMIARLDGLLPGTGTPAQRYESFRSKFIIPRGKLDTVFQAAIRECRDRTRAAIDLPDKERFTLEYVTNKSWSGYNWYQGSGASLIQINTDLPIYIDRAVDLAAHEGYPGHHVYNSLLEAHLARELGWVEFTVYALFSPQSLIAEGTANFGIEVAFPGEERIAFERTALFPLAGLDPEETKRYYEIHQLTGVLNYAHNEAARGYLNGTMSRTQAEEWLIAYALMSDERAAQRVRFIDAYRSYVINYNLGQDLVRHYIEARGGTSDNPSRRWQEFRTLISSPRLPSGLTVPHSPGKD